MNAPDYLIETAEESVRETERFAVEHQGDSHVKAILTPRFAPTCSEQLLKGLADIGKRYHLGLQTPLVESRAEASWTKELLPADQTDGDLYEKLGLLDNGPVIFAHVIFPEERDLEVLKKHSCMTVHCPDATCNITAGIMPVKSLAEDSINICLGSDIGGGHGAGIYRQAARAVQLSKMKEFYEEGHRRVPFAQAFYMATASGGSVFGNVGQLKAGYQFNALVIDGLEDEGAHHSIPELVERFFYFGDDRNIKARYLDGVLTDPEEVYRRLCV
jgi:guanine deaminase